MHAQDHRSAAKALELLHFQDEAPGMVFWHPAGRVVFSLLEDAVRKRCLDDGYREVRTPQLLRAPVWERSGHWERFSEGLFKVPGELPAALKPVSCPGHIEIVRRMRPSHHDLPVKLCELGLVHRDEQSGALHGLLRLRQFTQDDGHVFCAPHQAVAEVERFLRGLVPFYAAFGFDRLHVALSTRPEQRHGDDALWDRAESMLAEAAASAGLDFDLHPGGGAFYGPKIEVGVEDRLGRIWQCGTIQLDFVLPERFDLSYVDADGERKRPVMLHRALCGSLERFLGVLLEHHEGHLPAWLAPVQVQVLPVRPEMPDYAQKVVAELRRAGLRVELDGRRESLGKRVAEAHAKGVPFIVVVGPRDEKAGSVAVREGEVVRVLGLAAAVEELATLGGRVV